METLKSFKIESGDFQQVKRETLRSIDRVHGSSHDMVINFSTDLPVEEMFLENVLLPVLYNIDSTNNVIRLEEPAATFFTLTLTPGGYTMTNLLAHISTVMSAAPAGTYTASYNSTTKKITISEAVSTAFTLHWEFSAATGLLARMLGWNPSTATASAGSQTAPNIADISVTALYLVIEEMGLYWHQTSDGPFNIASTFKCTMNVDATQNKNFLTEFNSLSRQVVRFTPGQKRIKNMHLYWLDQYGYKKNFQGGEWEATVVFKLYETTRY